MKIDRAEFLLLVGAITAATACTVTSSNSGTSSGSSSNSSTTTSSIGTGGSGGTGTGGAATGGTGTGGAATGGTGTGGAATGGAGGGPACLGDVGNVPACAGNTCEGGDPCPSLAPNVKQGVLEVAVTCLNKLDTLACTGTEECTCIQDALFQSCADPGSTPKCAGLTTMCGGVAIPNCKAYFDGLTPAGADLVYNCLANNDIPDCTEHGLDTCEKNNICGISPLP